MTDRDVGDMFLNFQLHKDGVDLSFLYNTRGNRPKVGRVGWKFDGLCGFSLQLYQDGLGGGGDLQGKLFRDRGGMGWQGDKSVPVEGDPSEPPWNKGL